jgi:aspartyl-tRNA(Asn)/glutamyl-tRNA(Gln) amidotransferase subunit A
LFAGVEAGLSPTTPIVSYPADLAAPTNDPEKPFEHIAFTVPWNMSEQPAASINCGFSASGMPSGLQIVGPRFGDMLVLRLSKVFES